MTHIRVAASGVTPAQSRNASTVALAAILLASAFHPSQARAGPLTFKEAIAHAQVSAPSLRANALGIEASRAGRSAAGALPDPKVSFGVDSFPISGPLAFRPSRDDFTWVRAGISQDIPNPAKRKAQRTRADADIAVAEASAVLEARNVEVETAIAWITLAYAERRLAAVETARGKLERLVQTTPAAVASGNARPGQVLAGRLALTGLDDRRDELAAAVGRARADLTRWTGEAEPQIAGPMPRFAVDGPGLRTAIDSNPSLGPPQARVGQAAASVRLAVADRNPDFGLEASYEHRDPRFGDYVSAGVTVSLPFFTRRRQNGLIAERLADASKADAEREAARRSLAADLEAGLADHAMHHEQWMRSRQTIEPLARERVDLETAGYSAGRASLLDVIDAHIALVDAALTALDREALVEIDGAKLSLKYRGAAR